MTEYKELRKVLDETIDWLSELPGKEIRQLFPEMRIPHNVDFVWEIGGTEYTVISHFKQADANDIVSIVGRLLEGEV